jgi:hypothetical protein
MPVDASSGTYVIKLVQEELEKHDAKSVGSFYHVRFHILNDANICYIILAQMWKRLANLATRMGTGQYNHWRSTCKFRVSYRLAKPQEE